MKPKFYTVKGKYWVNLMMIAVFAAVAFSGLIDRGGEHRRFSPGNFPDVKEEVRERNISRELRSGETTFFPGDSFSGDQEKELDFHAIAGLVWLGLMLFHIVQHWNWFKRMISIPHILKNKLLTFTILVFLVLGLSGICLVSDLIPAGWFNPREIHETAGKLLGILVVIHVVQRFRWIVENTRKLSVIKQLNLSKA
jgi:hypothetical protein